MKTQSLIMLWLVIEVWAAVVYPQDQRGHYHIAAAILIGALVIAEALKGDEE